MVLSSLPCRSESAPQSGLRRPFVPGPGQTLPLLFFPSGVSFFLVLGVGIGRSSWGIGQGEWGQRDLSASLASGSGFHQLQQPQSLLSHPTRLLWLFLVSVHRWGYFWVAASLLVHGESASTRAGAPLPGAPRLGRVLFLISQAPSTSLPMLRASHHLSWEQQQFPGNFYFCPHPSPLGPKASPGEWGPGSCHLLKSSTFLLHT